MKTKSILIALLFSAVFAFSQNEEKSSNQYSNTATNLMQKDSKLTIGGYGEIHYNQELDSEVRNNGSLDVHRLVMLFGYNFNERTSFVTELEFEHVKEVYVEQAFLNYKINNFINFRGGLLLVPMGIINEYHEPTTFNGVERPGVDKYIAPTTWREIGLGFTGNITAVNLKYQAYLMNGFNGYDNGSAKLNGSNGLRKGRQKGAESYISSPNFTAKVEYYGVRGLNIGVSGYFGKTQSTLFDGLQKDSVEAVSAADSSLVGVAMLGLDARYSISGLHVRGQFYYNSLSNTNQFNEFTKDADGNFNDLGSAMIGYYFEAGYNVFKLMPSMKTELIPFARYEHYNTQQKVESGIDASDKNNVNVITTGLSWKLAKGAVLKADMQFKKTAAAEVYTKYFNAGIGVMF